MDLHSKYFGASDINPPIAPINEHVIVSPKIRRLGMGMWASSHFPKCRLRAYKQLANISNDANPRATDTPLNQHL